MGWKVFLPDRYIKPAEQKIHEIAGSLKDSVPAEGGLMGGKAGLALFYSCYARWTRSRSLQTLVADWIEQGLNPAVGRFPGFSLANGLSGQAWLIHYLVSERLIELDPDNIYDLLDEYLHDFMMQEIRSGHYDYLHGALGVALYFLRDTGNVNYCRYLEEMVRELEHQAVKESDGSAKWISTLDIDTGQKGYNLGLAHGIPSIMIMLSKLLEAGILPDITKGLLLASVQYLDKQKLPPERYISMYPSWSIESTGKISESRLAWCYGDPGIGLAYREAGKILNDNSLILKGDQILIHAAQRKDIEENMVYDAGICHGSAGLALIFNILYQKTALIVYRDAALYWLDVCLKMSCHDDGLAGYKTRHLPEYGGWKKTAGLLEGIAGIGLCLLSFVTEQEPSWTSALLL